MNSISFYITTAFIKLKGIKSDFSKSPVDYLKLRKNDIKIPSKNLLLNQDFNSIKISQSILTEIVPKNLKNQQTAVLYCPGGASVYGPTSMNWEAIAAIAKETGLRSFLINYPKAPEVIIEEVNGNIDDVYHYLVNQESIKNIILIGDSMGGTLLMLLIQRLLKNEKSELPKSIILISPVADSSMTNPKIIEKDKTDIMLSLNGVLSAKKMCAGNLNLKSDIISPLYGSFKNFVSTHLFIAENDIMQPDQELLVEKMVAEKVNLNIYRGKKMPHIWPLLPFMKEAKNSLKTIIEIIKNQKSKTYIQ